MPQLQPYQSLMPKLDRDTVLAEKLAQALSRVAQLRDREAFARAQAQVLEAELRARKEAQTLFLAIASSLSKEERQSFARWQPEGPRAGRGPGVGGKRPDRLRAGENTEPPPATIDPEPSAGGNKR